MGMGKEGGREGEWEGERERECEIERGGVGRDEERLIDMETKRDGDGE